MNLLLGVTFFGQGEVNPVTGIETENFQKQSANKIEIVKNNLPDSRILHKVKVNACDEEITKKTVFFECNTHVAFEKDF